jgi:peptide/nickel transport system permease protein
MEIKRKEIEMYKYILRRLLQLIPIIFGITFLTFVLMMTVKGDAVDAIYENAGGEVSEEVKENKRKELGIDRPFLVQYIDWLGNLLQGDMGVSYISGDDVFDTFASKLPNTIYLALSSISVTIFLSIPLGIIAAVGHNKFIDYIIRFLGFIGNALPGFFISLLLIQIFAVRLGWFSVIDGTDFKSLILPTLTLSIAMVSKYTRQVRSAVLEELNKDYVIGAKARGVKYYIIIMNSVLKSVMLSIITLLALSIGSLLGGTAIVESIFMWDGVGKLVLDAIAMKDYPIIQAYVIWMAIIYVVINLITDILYHVLDPRVRGGFDE